MRVALCDMADFTAIFVLRVERTYHFIPTLRNIFAIGRKIEREEERERERETVSVPRERCCVIHLDGTRLSTEKN